MYLIIIVFVLAIAALIFSFKKLKHFLDIKNTPFKDKEKFVWDQHKDISLTCGMLLDLKKRFPNTQYKETIEDLYKIDKK
jgi:hypothetical protein